MSENKEAEYKIELRDLESLLRKKLGHKLRVICYTAVSLLPPGENYGSTILKVHAFIKINKAAKEEVLHLVAKMPPATEFQRKIFDSPYTFRKEAFLYEELIPSYQLLERKLGVEKVFDILPKLYGVRYSLKSDEDFDDDAVILMQNLKVLGYYTGERREGLDLEHVKIAITAMARFHALGIATKEIEPEQFQIFKHRSKCLEFQEQDNSFEESTRFFIQVLKDDPETGLYSKCLDAVMAQNSPDLWLAEPPEPWGTIIHSDFWVNNILFHKDVDGKVDNVKFVDFQNYLYLSPLRELIFFLMVSSNDEVIDSHIDASIDQYYENFVTVLKIMKCDVEPFRRDKFDERLKIDTFQEFLHCPFMLKMMKADIEQDFKPNSDEMKNILLDANVSATLLTRLRKIVKVYAEKGWFYCDGTENENKA